MFAIMVASAATLAASGVTTIQTADQAAQALKPIAGSWAQLLFAAGIVGTGALAVPVLAGSTGYALAEALGWSEGLSRKLREAPGFYAVIGASIVVALGLGFVGVNPIHALYLAAILNGLVAPPLILLMLVMSNSPRCLPEHRSRVASNTLTVVAIVVMTVLPIAYLVS